MKRTLPLIAVLMAAMLLLTGCLGSKKTTEDPNAPPTFKSEPGDDRIVGDFEVEVLSVKVGSANGKDQLLVATISYTNNSNANVTYRDKLDVVLFQDGVLLEDKSPSNFEDFDFDSTRKTIKPGATLKVDLAFKPENTSSAVEVEIYLKDQYYVDARASEKVRADYYGAVMELNGVQVSNTADTIAAERQAIIDEWEAEQARLAAEAAAAEAAKQKN